MQKEDYMNKYSVTNTKSSIRRTLSEFHDECLQTTSFTKLLRREGIKGATCSSRSWQKLENIYVHINIFEQN